MTDHPTVDGAAIDLDRLAGTTYTAVFSDVCDSLGLRDQTCAPGLAPVVPGGGTALGWARTARSVAVGGAPTRPYGAEIDFIDSLRPGDLVVTTCGEPAALWGELFSTAALGRGARGAVIDGLIRDRDKIATMPFPVFARGYRPTDSLARVAISETDESITVAGVSARTGDLVVADSDGIVVVPRDVVAEVVPRVLEKATTEDKARGLLLEGGLLADVWERFRVL
jgi:4-hydroxy-4-methyl-2-oxoglutarate aldolase